MALRSRATAAVVAVVAIVTVAVAVALVARPPTQAVVPTPTPATTRPYYTAIPVSPTPTEAPTASPTLTPTPRPTATRTPRPRPTTNASGQQLIPFYLAARQLFPLFPPAPQIDFDEPSDIDGDAWFRGLTPTGIPIFAVREDFKMTPRTAYHEIGHAYEELLKRSNASVDWRARYWSFRSFPGTWQQAQQTAASQPPGMAQWVYLPGESWAEAFSIAAVGSGQEKTVDYGRTIDPAAARAFFQSLGAITTRP